MYTSFVVPNSDILSQQVGRTPAHFRGYEFLNLICASFCEAKWVGNELYMMEKCRRCPMRPYQGMLYDIQIPFLHKKHGKNHTTLFLPEKTVRFILQWLCLSKVSPQKCRYPATMNKERVLKKECPKCMITQMANEMGVQFTPTPDPISIPELGIVLFEMKGEHGEEVHAAIGSNWTYNRTSCHRFLHGSKRFQNNITASRAEERAWRNDLS